MDVFRDIVTMHCQVFREVAWRQVYDTLHSVPRLFQSWACKQVTGVAGTNVNLNVIDEEHDSPCPSCGRALELETCDHVLHCKEAGRVDTLKRSIYWLEDWLRDSGTELNLRECMLEYAQQTSK